MKGYIPRLVDQQLKRKLKGKGAVLIQGPKWCGKTTTAEQVAESIIYMDEPERKEQNIQLADISPSVLLEGAAPRLIDEWQIAPKLWDAVIHLKNGNYGLVEIKLGGDRLINEGAANLLELESKIDTKKMPLPSFKMVLVGTDRYAYLRPDGVMVVPVGCLRE